MATDTLQILTEQIKSPMNSIAQAIQAAKEAIDKAETAKFASIKAANEYFEKTVLPHRNYLKETVNRYKRIAIDLAIKDGAAPKAGADVSMSSIDFEVDGQGLHMNWDHEEKWMPRQYLATWDRILEQAGTDRQSA